MVRSIPAKRSRPKVRITFEGVIYLLFVIALLLISLIQRLNLMTLFFSLAATLSLATLWMGVWNLRGVSASVRVPRDVHAGPPLEMEVEVVNKRSGTAALGISVDASLEKAANGSLLELLPAPIPAVFPEHPVRQAVRLGKLPRGIYQLQGIKITSRFPFGLFRFVREIPMSEELIVYPSLGQLEGRFSIQKTSGSDTSQRIGGQRGTQLDQYRHLRDYRSGDNPRHVHWRSSARRGQLMVKEFEPDGASPTMLLLDPTIRSMTQSDQFEKMVSVAATMCVEISRHSTSRGLLVIANAAPIVIEGQGSPRWLHQAFHELAAVQPSTSNNLSACLQSLQASKRLLSPQIWILGLQPKEHYATVVVETVGGDGISRRSRLQCIGASEIEKFFRWNIRADYAEKERT